MAQDGRFNDNTNFCDGTWKDVGRCERRTREKRWIFTTSPKFRNGCSQGEVVFDGLLQQRGTSEGKAIQWYMCYNSHPPVTEKRRKKREKNDRHCRWSRFDSKSVAWFCMAFALSLTLDSMFGIHSHKTSGNAQLFQLLKGNWKLFFFARYLRSS